jgi:hypothetical protein
MSRSVLGALYSRPNRETLRIKLLQGGLGKNETPGEIVLTRVVSIMQSAETAVVGPIT